MLPTGYLKTVIYMAEGRAFNGGLADRLRGIVSVYKLCKELNIAFKIHFTSPFVLKDYLLPNSYDWSILPDEICYNWNQARPCFIYTAGNSIKRQTFWAKHFFKERYKQIHVYTNMVIADKEYGGLFRELFKPTDKLESLVNYNRKQIRATGGGEDSLLSLSDFCNCWVISLNLKAIFWYCRIMKKRHSYINASIV
jgi:hypothetical protein